MWFTFAYFALNLLYFVKPNITIMVNELTVTFSTSVLFNSLINMGTVVVIYRCFKTSPESNMKKTICIFTLTVALLMSVTAQSYGADNVKLGKASSGILHKYMEYQIRHLSEEELAYEESFWEQRGTLMAGMTYDVRKIGEDSGTETYRAVIIIENEYTLNPRNGITPYLSNTNEDVLSD